MQDLGFSLDTVVLLPLVPIIQMTWAEGGITKAERELLVRLARSRGSEEGSAADRQLTEWMANRPADAVFAGALRLIRAVLDSGVKDAADFTGDDLVKSCEDIAAASGGILGFGRVSAEEPSAAVQHCRGPERTPLLTLFTCTSTPIIGECIRIARKPAFNQR